MTQLRKGTDKEAGVIRMKRITGVMEVVTGWVEDVEEEVEVVEVKVVDVEEMIMDVRMDEAALYNAGG